MLNKKDARSTTVYSLAALAGLTQSCAQKEQKLVPAEGTRPNIIYIMSDDHAYQAISAYGDPVGLCAPTPNIDRIAREGARFERAFVENSLSAPSRACLVTGRFSHMNGQRQLAEGIDSTQTYVSELMQQAGYQTACVGKWHLYSPVKGFDYYRVFNDQGSYWNPVFKSHDSDGKWVQEEGYATKLVTKHAVEFIEQRDPDKPFFMLVHHKAPHRAWLPDTTHLGMYDNVEFPLPETYYDNYEGRGIAARIQKMSIARDMRLGFDLKADSLPGELDMSILINEWGRMNPDQKEAYERYYGPRRQAFKDAHLSGEALDEWKYQAYLRDYLAVIHSVDESVGELYKYLEDNNLLENTIIIYDSDQGFYMGEHGWFDKRFMYEESLRTPLVVRYPRSIPAGTVNYNLVQNIDFAPTFLALAGAEQPDYMPGLPITRVFNGETPDDWRESIYYHYYDYPAWHMVRKHDGVRTDRYKLIHFYGEGGVRGAALNKYAMIEGTDEHSALLYTIASGDCTDNEPDVDYYELYDLQSDPHEMHSIYGEPGTEEITAKLMEMLRKYRTDLSIDEGLEE